MSKSVISVLTILFLILAGCTGYDVADITTWEHDQTNQHNMIRFKADAKSDFRAANDLSSNYGVFAKWSGSSIEWFMNKTEIDGVYNTYSPVKFWPSGNLNFYAFAPYTSTNIQITSSTVGELPVAYTVPGTDATPGNANEDFTIATPLVETTKEQGAMVLSFQHMLSKVTVNVVPKTELGYALFDVSNTTVLLKVAQNKRTTSLTNPVWNTSFAAGSTAATYRSAFTSNGTNTTAPSFWIIPQPAFDGVSKASIHVKNVKIRNNGNYFYEKDLIIHDVATGEMGNNEFAQGKNYTVNFHIDSEANSYIMKPNTTIKIPVSRCNKSMLGEQLGINDSFTAEVVWRDKNNPSNITAVTAVGAGPTGYIEVQSGTVEGNAVIAAKKNGVIIWSWHIWVTTYEPPAPGVSDWMDRNLGAIGNIPGANDAKGLFYQWGRKDPFPRTTKGQGNITIDPVYNQSGVSLSISMASATSENNFLNSVQNPLTFYTGDHWFSKSGTININDLWGTSTSKSIYDPCPKGWKIPHVAGTTSPWAAANFGNWLNYGRQTVTHGGYYPATGYRDTKRADLSNDNTAGHYWTGTPSGNNAYNLYFTANTINLLNLGASNTTSPSTPANGFSVRCVRE